MYSFRALEWVSIGAREEAIIAALPQVSTLYDPAQLVGQHVRIDGAEWLVTKTDTFAVPRGSDHPYRHSFGLVVTPVTPLACSPDQ
jgi:hypothetical protein